MKRRRATWKVRHRIVATLVLSAIGIGGFSTAATAAPAPVAAVAAEPTVGAISALPIAASGAATPLATAGDVRVPAGPIAPSERPGDSRVSIKPLIDAAVKIANALSVLVTGWEIWSWFH